MKKEIDLEAISKILKDSPLSSNDERINAIAQLFFYELLKINNSDKSIDNFTGGYEDDIIAKYSILENDFIIYPEKYYFYNLITRRLSIKSDTDEVKKILFDCIIDRYVTNKNIQRRLLSIKNDAELFKKFNTDLYFVLWDYSSLNNNIRLDYLGFDGEQGRDIGEDNTGLLDEHIDYQIHDETYNFLDGIKIKNETIQKFIIWRYRNLQNIKLTFKEDLISLPLKFNIINSFIARYYAWSDVKSKKNK